MTNGLRIRFYFFSSGQNKYMRSQSLEEMDAY